MLSRIVNGVLLVLAGAVIGGIGTVAHRVTVDWGVTVPLGLIGALVAYTTLLVGLRLLGRSRVPALLAAIGTIATVLLFTQQSAGGSVLIPNDLLGQIWLVAPILIAAVVVAWPDLRGRRAGAAPESAPAVSE